MSLLKTISVWVSVSFALGIALTLLPSLIKIWRGHATGFGLIVPPAIHWLPRPLQLLVFLVGAPLLLGSIGGSLWYYLRR
jgi:hypothetical protein